VYSFLFEITEVVLQILLQNYVVNWEEIFCCFRNTNIFKNFQL